MPSTSGQIEVLERDPWVVNPTAVICGPDH